MNNKLSLVIDFGANNVSRYVTQRYNIVAVDVLRATSTIIVAFAQGAKKIIPFTNIDEAKKIQTSYNALIIGERKGEQLPGFDFTNSPFDLSKENLKNKVIAITSTAGTPLITKSIGAQSILIGSAINAMAVAKRMQQIGGGWAVIGAGFPKEEFIEDQVGCAMIAKEYIHLTDAIVTAEAQKIIDNYSKDQKKHILNSPASCHLFKLGRKCDVDFVINSINSFNNVPVLRQEKDNKKIQLIITDV